MKTGTFVLVLGVAVVAGTAVAIALQGPMPRTPQEALQWVKLQTGLFWAQAQQTIADRTGAVKSSLAQRSQAAPQPATQGGFSQAAQAAQARVEQQARIQQTEADRLQQAAARMGDGAGQAAVGKLSAIMEDQARVARESAQALGQAGAVTGGR